MPLLWKIIAWFLAVATAGVVARVLGALGMGIIVLQGVEYGFERIESLIESAFGQIGSDIYSMVILGGFDVYITLVISAHFGVWSFLAVAGSLRRLGFVPKPEGS